MSLLLAVLACTGGGDPTSAAAGATTRTPTIHTKTVISKPYSIDQMYASMRGPYGFDDVVLLDAPQPELLWIVGYRTEVVDAGSAQPMSQEFMCHANLDFETKDYYARFPTAPPVSGRVFTLSQGQQDIEFPEGFGIPVTSDLPISLATQVLNLNIADPKGISVRHKVEIRFVRDAEVVGEMVPLFQGAAEGFKALGDARHYGFSPEEVAQMDAMGSGCSAGTAALAGDSDDDSLGQQFTAHWLVPPGREVNVTNVTRFLNLPYDTRAHYIAVHLHPFAERLVLEDLTAKTIVFDAHVTPSPNRVGIDRVEHYASAEGLPLYKDHQYQLTSYYNNTSGHDVDSMAVMYLYLRDERFVKPTLAATPAPPTPTAPRQPSM